jgi:hypothetical protein
LPDRVAEEVLHTRNQSIRKNRAKTLQALVKTLLAPPATFD